MLTLPPRTSHFNAAGRAETLHKLASEPYDVLVIGGGVTGAGVALDAASRGLKTALIEHHDLAAGTSRWSSKLVHGGLRYLAKGDVGVAWESASERAALMTTIAPHLCRPAAFVVPLDAVTSNAMGGLTGAGTLVGDLLRAASQTPRQLLPPPHLISAQDALLHVPALQPEHLRGAVLYWDGQLEDDARLVLNLAATAHAFGADVLTRCAASDVQADRVTLTDRLSGQSFTARGQVVNATGVWAAEHEEALSITPSRGSHLVVRSETLGMPRAVFTAPVPGHFGRYVFGMPQPDGLTFIGLTDEAAPGVDGVQPPVPPEDEAFLLDTVNQVLRVPLTSADVVGRFAGLRPLATLKAASGATADISRRHLLLAEEGRPVTIAGGKLTTYRRMAEDAVDAVCRRLGRGGTCRTRQIPLVGAASAEVLREVAAPPRLVRRYGTAAPQVWALTRQAPWLAAPVAPSCPTIGAEFAYGVLAEGALDAEDLLERRTRVSMVDADVPAARETAERVLAELRGHTALASD